MTWVTFRRHTWNNKGIRAGLGLAPPLLCHRREVSLVGNCLLGVVSRNPRQQTPTSATVLSKRGARTMATTGEGQLIAVIADEDTITGFLLSGVGNIDIRKKSNFLVVDGKTQVKTIESAFKEFTNRDDIAIVLISQNVASQIRGAIDQHTKAVPSVLEIPSKDAPYEPGQDGLLQRVKHIMGSA